MQLGHEDCGHETEIVKAWGGDSWNLTRCHHDHDEEVKAYDVLDNGPTVADYCACCGSMRRRPEYK